MSPSMYAELLPNLRQVSLAVWPSTDDHTAITSVRLTPKLTSVMINATELALPARVSPPTGIAASSSGHVSLPLCHRPGTTVLSWRLPLHPRNCHPADDEDATPWPAQTFSPGATVHCRSCHSLLIPEGKVREWKDLPSENWAEMMEFWHCHKPGEEHGHDQCVRVDHKGQVKADEATLATRGYGASSMITAREGVGFVDVASLWFSEGDCGGVAYSKSIFAESARRADLCASLSPEIKFLNMFCVACQAQLGHFTFSTAAVTFFKWQVSIGSPPQNDTVNQREVRQPNVQHCLSALLAATAARSGSSKSLILPPNTTATASTTPFAIHTWMLNSRMRYSCSTASHAATKIFYRFLSREEATQLLCNAEKLGAFPEADVQEITLPSESIVTVAHVLKESNELFPKEQSGAMGRLWKLGLLERWEGVCGMDERLMTQ